MAWSKKALAVLRRDGALGSLRTALRRAGALVALSEEHVWYLLDACAAHPPLRLAPGVALDRPRDPDMRALGQVTSTLSARQVRARLRANNDLWLASEGGRAVFSCWVFRELTPTIAAPGGQLALPPDTVCLEDVLAAPAARGRGIAPAAYVAIAGAVAAEGRRWLVTKVAVENASARRAVEKAGFEAVARMRFTRVLARSRTSLAPLDGPRGEWLVERVDAGLRTRAHTHGRRA